VPRSEHIQYLALLGNVDRSILHVSLGDGFVLAAWPTDRFVSFYEKMHGSAEHDILFKVEEEWGCSGGRKYRPKSVYVVEKNLPNFPIEMVSSQPQPERMSELFRRMAYEKEQSELLADKVRKLRLCAPGAIKVCVEFFYSVEAEELEMQASTEESLHCTNRLFKIRKADLPKIQELMEQPPLSYAQKYIAFALDNYNQSYRVAQTHLEFLTLMLALEAIFNDGKQELRNKVSRGCAVLIGRNKDESRRVFKGVRDLYDKRSVLVHTGDTSKVRECDVEELHAFVRQGLVRALALDLPKDKFTAILQEAGFGQGRALAKRVTMSAVKVSMSVD
jgi:hypothetical protein